MGKKGPDKRKRPGPVRDWDLWREVGRTIDPILKRKSADPKAMLEALEAQARNAESVPDKAGRSSGHFSTPAMPSSRPVIAAANRSSAQKPKETPIEPGLKRRLERGHVPIDGTLDLHGLTQEQAFAALKRFIPARAARGDRTVLVITGKGLKKTGYLQIEQKGILRAMLPLWLADRDVKPFVAGIDQAHQSHGGEGAFYVRLKRIRP
ncbi:Smr/MutS family protein [Pelagibacterium lentulum]|uniref:DNA mismatch repair protein MutS n=1 Tax=Pelagibacterium lentulum TaxID=2029865 RepID=A0A916R5P8_9HYPH|nr:Smr/MutS family protein [Pelagibacterium lentulum]GGA37460.1 DNA mismatch repair protein MutS [Pelagibacterium lentulum]